MATDQFAQKLDENGNPDALRVSRTGTPRKVTVSSATPTRIDATTPAGRKVVHLQNLHATDDVNFTLSDSAPALAPFVLAAGELEASLPLLFAGWTWVEGPMGDSFTLLIASTRRSPPGIAVEMANRLSVGETVRAIDVPDQAWPAVFRGASALLHGGGRRNAAALRWALASGLPVAAPSTPVADSVLGPAGFLVPNGDSRSLGAACLTLLVEDGVAESLRERGLERAASYRSEGAKKAWLEALISSPRA